MIEKYKDPIAAAVYGFLLLAIAGGVIAYSEAKFEATLIMGTIVAAAAAGSALRYAENKWQQSLDDRLEKLEQGQANLEQGQASLDGRLTNLEQGQEQIIKTLKRITDHLNLN